ncbi:MAG: hypothetical protein ACJAUM_001051 [Pseudomonadales bacterium]|jgi:hypothetical protein
MPSVLTHKAIMLLAKERVSDIHKVLKAKVDKGGATITTLDRQVLAIAKTTLEIFTSEPRPRGEVTGLLFAEPVGDDNDSYSISQYAVLGSMGPGFTAFSSALAPGQSWVFDTIKKGTPDKNRELVNAQTCDFILHFWEQVKTGIDSGITDTTKRNAALQKMRAYVLGHLCHIAGEVVSQPYINDFEWKGPPKSYDKLRTEIEAEIDALVATQLLQRETTISGNDWDKWWPSEDLPEPFFDAYAGALERVYKAQSEPRKGFKQFDLHLESLGSHIAMNASFIKDGYQAFRQGVIAKRYSYGYWSWFGWLSFLFVPALALPLTVAALPRARNIFLSDENNRTERAWMEYLSTPMLFGLPASIIFSALIGSITTRDVEVPFWLGMGGAILSAVAGIAMLATIGVNKLPAGVSWSVFFTLPLVITSAQTIIGIIADTKKQGGLKTLAYIHSIPLAMLVLFFVFFAIFPGLLFPDENASSAFESEGFWTAFVVWVVVMIAFWFSIPVALKKLRIPEKAKQEEPENIAGGIAKPRFVRLFDDTTLHHDQELDDANIPSLTFPSGHRELLKLWWSGAGDLYIRSDRYQLVFSSHEDGRNPQIVSAPITPMSSADYLLFLTNTVVEPGTSSTGGLEGAIVHDEDPDYPLPAGALFADHGDMEETVEKHDEEAIIFKQIGDSAQNSDYILSHSRKSAQAVKYGTQGPVSLDRNLGPDGESSAAIEIDEETQGWPYLHDPESAQYTNTLMSIAGDFGALLSMSAVTHMVSGLKDRNNNDVKEVYQVFKNWNLDRRRLNEWRTIVSGGAINEKGSERSGYTSEMLGEGLRPDNHESWKEALLDGGNQTAFDEGESIARQLGWTKVLRDWMDVSRVSTQVSLGSNSHKTGNPSNQQLSRAMAYLLDLADPEIESDIEGGT